MIRVVTFFGDQIGKNGMPDPWRQYAVYLVDNPAPGVSASATITAVVWDAPLPEQKAFATANGGTEEALRLALVALKAVNLGLNFTGGLLG